MVYKGIDISDTLFRLNIKILGMNNGPRKYGPYTYEKYNKGMLRFKLFTKFA